MNLPRHGGVQLELPPRTRSRTVPLWADLPPDDPIPHQVSLIGALAAAATSWS